MKRIVLTGGGTAGHVTPHLALLPHLIEEGYDIHYIGTEKGIERSMMEKLPGITYHAVKSGKLRRYFSWQNFIDPFKVIWGCFQAVGIIARLKPNVCFSKGGFVSVPVVVGSWLNRVPVVCHESDLTPGLANKICSRFAARIATTFPECAQSLGPKAEMTGTPLRPELFAGSRAKGLAFCGLDGKKPILMMMGGSLGARSVNKALRDALLRKALPDLLGWMDVIHICGKGNLDETLFNTPGYFQVEFVTEELPDIMAAADMILSRAGSNALCEFQALCKPMLLIPYPKGASRGDQILNAQSYEKRGLCHVLRQEDMTAETLKTALKKLAEDRENLIANLHNAPAADGTQAILKMIHEVEK